MCIKIFKMLVNVLMKYKKDFKIKMLGKKILTQQSQGVVKTSRLSKCSSKLMNSLKPL